MNYERYYYQDSNTNNRTESGRLYAEQQEKKGWFSSVYAKLGLGAIGMLAFILIVNSATSSSSSAPQSHSATSAKAAMKSTNVPFGASDFSIQMKIKNPDYGELDTSLLTWKLVAEPARSQIASIDKFVLNDQVVELTDSKATVTWSINGKTYTGVSTTFELPANSFGQKLTFSVTVTPKKGYSLGDGIDSDYTFTHQDQVMVKYVRREIRTLTDVERNKFLVALQKVYSVSEEEGQKLYGAKFHNIEYFLFKHLNGAGRNDCDHWHDGAGIITHHAAYTLEVEQAVQAVDPSLAMPYWEYGMDKYLYTTLADSPLFGKDWFGEMSPSNPSKSINDGSFWADVNVVDGSKYKTTWDISTEGSLNPFVNAYGAMRSPWNNNPSSKIGRHNDTFGGAQYSSAPACPELRSCFQEDSLSEMNYCLNGATHGPVHIMIGGAWGDEDLFAANDLGYLQNPDKILLFKVLWRLGYTRCPETCAPGESCRCSVPQEYIDKYGVEKILTDSNIIYVLSNALKNADEAKMLSILRAVEHPGIAGEMFSSGASFDPTFWPLHGSMERMLNYKRIQVELGEITHFDASWGYPDFDKTSGAAYLDGNCDWSKVTNSADMTLPDCNTEAICWGHQEDDVLEFSNFINKGETYTNIEMLAFLHPWNDELPYTYDTYSFQYCTEQGYDFMDFSNSKQGGERSPARKGLKHTKKAKAAEKAKEEEEKNLRKIVSGM